MRILVIGSGGREHVLVWALSRSGKNRLFAAPGNPGIASLAGIFDISATDIESIIEKCSSESIDLVVVGPEVPLAMGLADSLRKNGVACFGPGKDGARLESSKWFAKEIMNAAGVPTASGEIFTDSRDAEIFIRSNGSWVIKANGLAAGKGVFLPDTEDEAVDIVKKLLSGSLGNAGKKVIIEKKLIGREVSILAICSGTDCVLLPPSRDHKRIGEGDTGPNTGGMGAICPPPELEENLPSIIKKTIIIPVLEELASRDIDYRGVLYAGLMITNEGPEVIEFNVRFGDPEAQAVLPLLEDDLAELCLLAAKGEKLPDTLKISNDASACIVLASGGYPGNYRKGFEISGAEDSNEGLIFHAGTKKVSNRLFTDGGRVLDVVCTGNDIEQALEKVYKLVKSIKFESVYYRCDIGRTH